MAMAMIAAPASLPVSLASVKGFLKVENTEDDQLISELIDQAVSHVQNITGHKLITQSWRFFFDDLPSHNLLELPLAPIMAPIEVRVFDDQGIPQIIPSSDYQLDIHSKPARLWINTQLCAGQHLNGLEVDLQVGFGLSGVDVPGDLIRAIMVTISHWYEFRGAVRPADQPPFQSSRFVKIAGPLFESQTMTNSSIDPGRMRHRLTLERENEIPDGCGGFSTDWQLVSQVWAAMEPVSSSARDQTGALNALVFHKITIRWRADCLPRMRFLKSGRKFLVNTISDPDETKRYLVCMCEEIK